MIGKYMMFFNFKIKLSETHLPFVSQLYLMGVFTYTIYFYEIKMLFLT